MDNDLIGRQLGPYTIIELLGYEGLIEYFRGHHPELNRNVLVRIVGRHLEEDPLFSARFRRDAKAISKLRHPNIARIFDFGAVQGGHYIVVDDPGGVTLANLLNEVRAGERVFDVDDITFIIRQIAAALDHSHRHKVVHQDVRPDNIILTRSGQAILDGFGMYLLYNRGGEIAEDTLDYAAPELIEEPQNATPTSDIYAMGGVLYELLTGERPYEAGSDIDAVLRNLSQSAPDPRLLNPDIPFAVSQVVTKALATDPRNRFSNAMQLATMLEWAYANPHAESLPTPKQEGAVEAVSQAADDIEDAPQEEKVIVKRQPTRREVRRDKKRTQDELNRIQKEEDAEQRRIARARKQEERQQRQIEQGEQRAQKRVRRRGFFANWGRSMLAVLITILFLGAIGYGLQTIGILSIGVDLPTLDPPVAEVEVTPTEAPTPTSTATSTPTITPSPTALQGATTEPIAPVQITPLEIGSSGFRLVDGQVIQFIPSGQFLMGTNARGRNIADQPQHTVMLSDYWIGRTEISNTQYRLCVEDGFCKLPNDTAYYDNINYVDFPVMHADYEKAVAYCFWLTTETGQVTGLPTEAQWEKAASWDEAAGIARLFPWGNSRATPARLRYNESGSSVPAAPVGSHPDGVSPYGVEDMAGNLWEWTADWFDRDTYKQSGIALDPIGPLTGTTRATRGGSWTRSGSLAVSSFRNPVNPSTASNEIGFRCATNTSRPPASSGIILSPLQATESFRDLVQVEQEQNGSDQTASVDEASDTFTEWIEAFDLIEAALRAGDNRTALVYVERRITLLGDGSALPFSEGLVFRLSEGLFWMQRELTPEPTPTPTITVTPET